MMRSKGINKFQIQTALIAVALSISSAAFAAVTPVPLPMGGIQPQAVLDARGAVHVVYFVGDPMHGDLFYMTKGPGASFSVPVRVNSVPKTAIAMGTIRPAQMAVGKGGRVYVMWNGSDQAPRNSFFMTRLNDARQAFEPQRNLLHERVSIDGGGTIACDQAGSVYVLWHATPEGKRESAGRIFMTESHDDGATFAPERAIDSPSVGTCGCCSMKAAIGRDNRIYVLYRAAGDNTERDVMLLTSSDRGRTFTNTLVQKWPLQACPMTTFSLTDSSLGMMGGWESQRAIHFAPVSNLRAPVFSPVTDGRSKFPEVSVNPKGDLLYSWIENAGWGKSGTVCWQVYDQSTKRLLGVSRQADTKTWNFTASVAEPGGDFLLFF